MILNNNLKSRSPVEKGSGKYPYVNFKKNIADDFKQQGGGDRSTSDATLTISSPPINDRALVLQTNIQ